MSQICGRDGALWDKHHLRDREDFDHEECWRALVRPDDDARDIPDLPSLALSRNQVTDVLLAAWMAAVEASIEDTPRGHCERLADAILAAVDGVDRMSDLHAACCNLPHDESHPDWSDSLGEMRGTHSCCAAHPAPSSPALSRERVERVGEFVRQWRTMHEDGDDHIYGVRADGAPAPLLASDLDAILAALADDARGDK